MRNLNLIGPQVRRLRTLRGWSQDRLAAALQMAGLDVTRSRLAKVEARMICVTDHELPFYLKALRVDYADLYPPLEPHGPNLYDHMERLMKGRF